MNPGVLAMARTVAIALAEANELRDACIDIADAYASRTLQFTYNTLLFVRLHILDGI